MSLRCLVVCPPGLEAIVAHEIIGLGMRPGKPVYGGVPVDVSQRELYELNLRLRTATRVLLRLGNAFVDGEQSLGRLIDSIEWARYLDGASLTVSASATHSTLMHTGLIADRVESHIRGVARLEPDGPPQRVSVRIDHDRATVSLDASGERLDRRGYRLDGAHAPMRESLAAALLTTSGWDGRVPLVDPFCGSGTILIEAALIAGGRAPGAHRPFAFQQWPSFTRKALREARDRAVAAESDVVATIVGGDRDRTALEASVANADRAGVGDAISWWDGSALQFPLPDGPGVIVTNPPYGVRLGDHDRLRDLYDAWGRWLRTVASGWTVTMVDADRTLTSRLGLPFTEMVRTSNGGIDVRFVGAVVA